MASDRLPKIFASFDDVDGWHVCAAANAGTAQAAMAMARTGVIIVRQYPGHMSEATTSVNARIKRWHAAPTVLAYDLSCSLVFPSSHLLVFPTVLSHTIAPVPAVGSLAPDFTLPSTSDQDVSLVSFRGKQPVLIAFFPLAFTSTCTKELCAFTDDYDQFGAAGVAILPISVDARASLKEFKAKLGMKTDLLSDFKREACSAYGTLRMDKYYSNRAYFLVDKAGVLRWVHVEAKTGDRRENSEILAQIAKLG